MTGYLSTNCRMTVCAFCLYTEIQSRLPIQRKKWNHTIETTILSIDRSIDILTRLDNDDRALIQKYTQLTTQKETSIVDIANHLNLPIDEKIVSDISAANDIRKTGETMQIMRSSFSKRFFRLARNRGITPKLGNLLRAVRIPEWLYFRLRRMTTDFDSKSLYHANHVASNTGIVLSEEEQTAIASRYGELKWFGRE